MEEEENILNLLPEQPVIYVKEKRHVSLHHGRAVEGGRVGRQERATMGPPSTLHRPHPTHYLKKHHRLTIDTAITLANHGRRAEEKRLCEKRPPIPSPVTYPPPDKQRGGVNWIQLNVTGVGPATHLSKGPGKYVDTCTGSSHQLLTSGLHPRYVFKKGYGRVPTYLQGRKEEEKEEEEERRKDEEEERVKEEIAQFTEEEKKELIEGLRLNQRECERRLQCLPVLCETRASKQKRTELEEQLADYSTYLHLLNHYKITLTD